jgi:hypothetical protein
MPATIVSAIAAYWTVITVKGGGIWAAPMVVLPVLCGLIFVTGLPRFRAVAFGSGLFGIGTLALLAGSHLVASGHATRFLIDLGFEHFISLTVFVVALVFELAVPASLAARIHPATAATAAAFLFVPTLGTDVITTWHASSPSLAAALLVAIPLGTRIARSRWNQVLRVVEPAAVVLLGWSVAFLMARDNDVTIRDPRWLWSLIALPAMAAALCGVGKYVGSRMR